MTTKLYLRQRTDPCFVVPLAEALEKAGPYVGPRGGLWADIKHTIHWEPKKHGTERLEAMLADLVPGDKVKGVAEQLGRLSADQVSKLVDDVKKKIKAISARGDAVPMTLLRWQRILESVKPVKVKVKPEPKKVIKPPPEKKPPEKAPEQLSFALAPPAEPGWERMPEKATEKELEKDVAFAIAESLVGKKAKAAVDAGWLFEEVQPKTVGEASGKGLMTARQATKLKERGIRMVRNPDAVPVKTEEPETSVTKPKPPPKKGKTEPDIVEVGEHIWGSRKDLSDLAREVQSGRRTIDAGELSKMSYDDAAYLVTKQNLIPPHNLAVLKGLGHTPGAAHLALAVLSFIKAKPADTAQARQQYAEDVRLVLSSLRGAKTFDEIDAMLTEWNYAHRRAQEWAPISKVELGAEGAKAAEAEAKRLTEETGVEHVLVYSYRSGRQLAKRTPKPFESLGKRFTSMLGNQWKNKAIREAKREARNADGAEDGWAYLQERGVATTANLKKRREERLKHLGETKRGFSEAALYQGLAGTVERTGYTVEVKDANADRAAATFNMPNIGYGQPGYMTQADREHHTKMFEGAMHDFSEILGVEPPVLSFKGRLGIAFGARGQGNVKAHYEPNRKVINITKFSGGGSLAHEWGHALDNVMAELFRSTTAGKAAGVFLSEAASHSSYPPKVRTAVETVMQAIKKHPDPIAAGVAHRRKVQELDARVVKAIDINNKLVAEFKKLRSKPESQEQLDRIAKGQEKRIKDLRGEIRSFKTTIAARPKGKPTIPQSTELSNKEFWLKQRKTKLGELKAAGVRTEEDNTRFEQLQIDVENARMDINHSKGILAKYRKIDPTMSDYATAGHLMGVKYWGSERELFARGFESWVQDELTAANRKSAYLTGGVKTTRKVDTGYVLPSGKPAEPYPRGKERELINQAMCGLVDTLKETGDMEKALMLMIPLDAPAVAERFVLRKAGPYIGPRGGKWQDPKHTIPWKPEALPGKGKEPEQWGKLPPGKTAKEHFRIAHEFLRKHKAALPGIKAAIAGLAGKGAEISARTKTLPSALGKLVRKPDEYGTADKLQDGTGLRVVHKTIREVRATVEQLKAKYKVIDEDDYITKPQGSYRSHHLIIEGPGGLAMEVQVRTANQNVFADWSHDVYKPVTAEQAKHRANSEVAVYEKAAADFFWAADNERSPPPPPKPPCTKVILQAFGCI